MKMTMMNFLKRFTMPAVLAFALLIVSSCEKVIEPENLPEQDPRLVLNSFIQNDSVFSARISSSKSIVSGKDYKLLEGAYCAVYENGNFVEQLISKGKGYYLGTKFGKPGSKYTVVARYSGYKDVEGISILPASVSLKRVTRYDTSSNKIYVNQGAPNMPKFVSGTLKFKITLPDNPDAKEYYALAFKLKIFDANGDPIDTTFKGMNYSFNDNNNSSSSMYTNEMLFLGDDNVNAAGEVVFDVNVGINLPQTLVYVVDSLAIECVPVLVSEDYFKYFQTAYKQFGQGPSFFMEPVLVYNNISNGMGIVAAMSVNQPTVIHSQKLQ